MPGWKNTPEGQARNARVYGSAEYQRNRKTVLRRAGGHCERCGRQARLQVDHIVNVAAGGSHAIENLQALCETCHRHKTGGEGNRASRRGKDPDAQPRTRW